jgi:tetratricopeptide (TPR) repeat protein
MRAIGDEHRTLQALQGLALCCREVGDLERAKTLAQELRDGAQAAGDRTMEAAAFFHLALAARDEGRVADALALLNEDHRILQELGPTILTALNLLALASLIAPAGDHDTAARLLGCAEARRTEADVAYPALWVRKFLDPTREIARTALGEPAFSRAWEEGLQLTAAAAVELALATPHASSGTHKPAE